VSDALEIDPRQLAEMLRRGEPLFLLDVRNGWEHELARLPDHALIPVQELGARLDEVRPPPGARIVCYCHHGVRSLTAASILRQAGFSGALSLAGGIDLWSRLIDPSVPRY
jgi:rhodanese-related sulfurtransferase